MACAVFPSQKVRIKLLDCSYKGLPGYSHVKFKSQGIATVAVGQVVYLGVETGDEDLDIEKYQWSLDAPENSGSKLSDATIANPILIPGQVGQYNIKLTVTTKKGISIAAALWITAGNFVGNGAVVDMNNKAQCIHCHREKVEAWKTTAHADAFNRAISGKLAAGYYKIDCFICHRTGYDKESIWAAMGKKEYYHFQEELEKRGLEGFIQDLPQVANLVSVQCESCHGPGSAHMGKIDKNQISKPMSPGVCAMCHDSNFKGKGGMTFDNKSNPAGKHPQLDFHASTAKFPGKRPT